jgi:hypothetical protein
MPKLFIPWSFVPTIARFVKTDWRWWRNPFDLRLALGYDKQCKVPHRWSAALCHPLIPQITAKEKKR